MSLGPSPKRKVLRHVRPSDLRAAAQLATQATQGVIDIAEGVHRSVHRQLGLSAGAASGRTGGLTGQVYLGVRGVTRLVGRGLDRVLGSLLPLVDNPAGHPEASAERRAALAALNGVLGDRLQASGNPLAQAMMLCVDGRPLALDAPALVRQGLGRARPHLLLLVHGLCMNDAQWQRHGHDHGACLSQALGATPVYLRYNSGLHIAVNGRQLARQLERLLALWPVPPARLTIVGHSMGGLVARAAVQAARDTGLRWPTLLHELVFLGTPHHGAPLERAGHVVDLLLGATPFSAPFARLGKLRSAGITDLRHGQVLDTEGQGRDPLAPPAGAQAAPPLPDGVACFAVAATLAGKRGLLADRLTGDGLVPLHSALGHHAQPQRRLAFAPERQYIAYRTGHLDLLSSAAVAAHVLAWLRAGLAGAG